LITLPRALPIQSYTDGISHSVTAIAVCEVDHGKNIQRWLLSACDKIAVLTDIVTGKAVRRFRGHIGRINAVTFSQGAETCLTASYDATVRIWDIRSQSSHEPIQCLKEAKDSVTAIHVMQDTINGTAFIRTGSVDGVLRTYDLRMGVIQCDDCGSPIVSLSPTYDKQSVAVSCLDGKIRLLDCDSGELVNVYESGHIAGQYAMQCSITANDTTLVTGSENGDAILYDIVQGGVIQKLQGHTAPTCSIACHPEQSDVMVTASYDGNVVVWAHDQHYIS
jgi:mitogen-activated protein kinase organizer 1